METRANFVMIGLFAIAGILGALLFVLWLAKVEVDRQFAYYDVLFDDVSGLGQAGDVRYNGLAVGQVVDLALDDVDPSKVRVRLEVRADTPVKTDTVARLQVQGVTGVSFVALSGGSPASDALPDGGEIESRRSVLQSVMEGAPQLMDRALLLLEDVNDVVNDQNRAQLEAILSNVATATARLDTTLEQFEGLSENLGVAAREVAAFTGRLEQVADTAEVALNTATSTLETADTTFDTITQTLETDVSEAIADVRTTAQTVTRVIDDVGTQATAIIADVQQTAQTATRVIDQVGQDMSNVAGRLETLSDDGRVALAAATETFGQANITLGDISTVMSSAQTTLTTVTALVQEDIKTTIADIRQTARTADRVIDQVGTDAATVIADVQTTAQTATRVIDQAGTEITALTSDVRQTAQTANTVIAQAGADFTDLSGRLDLLSEDGRVALAVATETFTNANQTLSDISRAMEAADTTLGSARQTFDAVNLVIEEDIDVIVADLRRAMNAFTTTVEGASQDIDVIADEVLAASRSASSFVGNLDGIVSENRRQVSDFLRLGLPEFSRFLEESRLLVRNLERLVDRVERDPARFLLGTQNSEFRR